MKGFSLLEMILAIGITALISGLILSILINNNGVLYKQNSLVSEGLSLNDTLLAIDDKIRQATGVAASYPQAAPIYFSGTNTLVLKLPALDSQGGVINNVYDYMVTTQDTSNNKILRLQVFPDLQSIRKAENKVLTTLVESIEFSFLDKTGASVNPEAAFQVGIDLTVLSKTGSIGSNRSSSSVTTLRNKNI